MATTVSDAIKSYLEATGARYKIHSTRGPTMTAPDAARELHVPLSTIVKTIVFTDQDDRPLLAILTGDRRVDRGKLSAAAGASRVRIASAEDTKKFTGFEVGTTPPLGHTQTLRTVIDQTVMGFDKVYGGSGTTDALLEISPRDLAMLTNAKIADICE